MARNNHTSLFVRCKLTESRPQFGMHPEIWHECQACGKNTLSEDFRTTHEIYNILWQKRQNESFGEGLDRVIAEQVR